jgi:hypothetical protein
MLCACGVSVAKSFFFSRDFSIAIRRLNGYPNRMAEAVGAGKGRRGHQLWSLIVLISRSASTGGLQNLAEGAVRL